MTKIKKFPKTLVDAIKYFADQQVAHDFVVSMRWPKGVKCPRCGSRRVIHIGHSENKIICQAINGAPASPKELQRPISLMGGAPSRDQDQPRLPQTQLAAG